jgi:two-component system sensor histidine kinase RegB
MTATPTGRSLIALPWLLRIRWWSVVGQLAVVGISAFGLGLDVPMGVLATLIAAAAASNVWATWFSGHLAPTRVSGSLLLLDVVILTAMLSLTGGPLNPFSMMYLVYITLAAVVLGSWWTWTITLVAAAGFAALFVVPMDEHSALSHALSGQLAGHLQGMWWAFAAAALLTAYFVVRLANEIDERDRQLDLARARAVRTEQLASLTTLAAGAAHELGTPLATIAVAAGELEHALTQGHAPVGALDDVRLIRQELDRSRAILDRMALRAGDPAGEMPQPSDVGHLVERAIALLSTEDRRRVTLEWTDTSRVVVPPTGFVQALAGLMRNGLDAGGVVTVAGRTDGRAVELTVRDTGSGIAPDIIDRVGEPFFTTKAPGRGMGLGVFLARLLVTDLGGTFSMTSTPGQGTSITLRLPMESRS